MDIDKGFSDFESLYMNHVQIVCNLIDANQMYAELGRGTGKTEMVMTPRIIRVCNDLPRELMFLVHKTYVALLTNVWPSIQASFSKMVTVNGHQRPLLEYGIDYVAGETKLPSHFLRPRFPLSMAHAFIEEMKHNSGEKLKSRLFPTLRGGGSEVRRSAYYAGITGVSDTARVDLGEDSWFEEYEQNMDKQLIDEIATVALSLNKSVYRQYALQKELRETKNPAVMEKIRLENQRLQHFIARWKPRLADMRRNAVFYMRASSFANKDILGPKFFKTQINYIVLLP